MKKESKLIKSTAKEKKAALQIKQVEAELKKKQKEIEKVKLLHKKLASQYIDLYLKERRIKRKNGLLPPLPDYITKNISKKNDWNNYLYAYWWP